MSLLLPANTTTDDVESLCVKMLVIDGGLACCGVDCGACSVLNDIIALFVVSAVILFGSDERISAAAFKIKFFTAASVCLMDIGCIRLFNSASDVGCGAVPIIGLSPIVTGFAIILPPSPAPLVHIIVGEMVEFIIMSDSIVELFGSTVSKVGDVLIDGIGCELSITSVARGD